MDNATISNVAFGAVFVAIGLAVFGVVSFKHAIYIGGGLLLVGFATKPADVGA